MQHGITSTKAIEILDSKGNPIVEVDYLLECGIRTLVRVLSEASTIKSIILK